MRLIDADELIKYIKIWEIGTSISSDQKEFIDCVNNQLTAFDADKVVEQIEELKKAEQNRPDNCDENGFGDGEQIYDDGRSQGRFEAFGEAIKIVKEGGVE